MRFLSTENSDRYLHLADSYWGECRDVTIEIRRVKVVKTRRAHTCMANSKPQIHQIPIGELAVRDSAKVEGRMGVTYTCLPCLDEWAKEIGESVPSL